MKELHIKGRNKYLKKTDYFQLHIRLNSLSTFLSLLVIYFYLFLFTVIIIIHLGK